VEALTLVALIALIWKITDAVKMLLAKDYSVVTQFVAWVVGVGAAFVAANSDIGENWDVGAFEPLGQLNAWSLVLLGLAWSSAGSGLVDFKRAFDRNDTAVVPSLGDRLNARAGTNPDAYEH
jgi:hypothetical protein